MYKMLVDAVMFPICKVVIDPFSANAMSSFFSPAALLTNDPGTFERNKSKFAPLFLLSKTQLPDGLRKLDTEPSVVLVVFCKTHAIGKESKGFTLSLINTVPSLWLYQELKLVPSILATSVARVTVLEVVGM